MASPTRRAQTYPAGPPVDYSFKDLKIVTDLVTAAPASGTPRNLPRSADENVSDYLEGLVAAGPSGPSPQGFNATSVRVCNNQLITLQGLDKALYHVLDDPSELVWLDASCNKLMSIDDIITHFPKLQVLYLHGNQIWQLSEVLKLTQLEHLTKLTLHGNPIAEQRNYKLWVGAHLPRLRSLDFSTITKVDRDKMNVWFAGYQKQQAARG